MNTFIDSLLKKYGCPFWGVIDSEKGIYGYEQNGHFIFCDSMLNEKSRQDVALSDGCMCIIFNHDQGRLKIFTEKDHETFANRDLHVPFVIINDENKVVLRSQLKNEKANDYCFSHDHYKLGLYDSDGKEVFFNWYSMSITLYQFFFCLGPRKYDLIRRSGCREDIISVFNKDGYKTIECARLDYDNNTKCSIITIEEVHGSRGDISTRFGVINQYAEIIVNPIYETIEIKTDCIEAKSRNERWHYLDGDDIRYHKFTFDGHLFSYDNGTQVIIPSKYCYASDFVNGYALVRNDDKYGLIDRQLNETTPCCLEEVLNFYKCYAIARKEGSYGCICYDGRIVVPFEHYRLKRMGEFIVSYKEISLSYGICNAIYRYDGCIIVSPKDSSYDFWGIIDEEKGIWGYVKNNCFHICDLNFIELDRESANIDCGNLILYEESGKLRINQFKSFGDYHHYSTRECNFVLSVDSNNKLVWYLHKTDIKYDRWWDFVKIDRDKGEGVTIWNSHLYLFYIFKGFVVFGTDESRESCVIIDNMGKELFDDSGNLECYPLLFNHAEFLNVKFSRGYQGVIDANANVFIPFYFYEISLNDNNILAVINYSFLKCKYSFEGKVFSYDNDEIVYIPEKYFFATDFSNGYAIVALEKENQMRFGIIDRQFNEVFPCVIDNLAFSRDSFLTAIIDGKKGFLSYDGKVLLPIEYVELEDYTHVEDQYDKDGNCNRQYKCYTKIVKEDGCIGLYNRDDLCIQIPPIYEKILDLLQLDDEFVYDLTRIAAE